jgi:thiol-disulfide isomerase/thioredoxin
LSLKFGISHQNSSIVRKARKILKNTSLRYFLYAAVALLAFGVGTWVSGNRAPEAQAASGPDALFALKLPDLANQPQSLSQWRGQVLVINFWATWCAPCREEIPMFVRLQQKYAGKGLQFVGISIDQVGKTREFATTYKINYPTLIGTFDTVEVSRQAGNTRRVLPFTVVLDRKGKVVATELGGLTEEKLEAHIKPLL